MEEDAKKTFQMKTGFYLFYLFVLGMRVASAEAVKDIAMGVNGGGPLK